MADLTGQTIGSYRLVEKLGKGGMAEVYKAYQPRLDRYVAIKFIRPELVIEEGFRARFEQEAKTIARLSHANIVHVYDFGEEGNRYYLVMEFVAGGTLKDRLQSLSDAGEVMNLDQAQLLIQQVGEALDHAHQQGVIHRDVKPANIMLTPDGRAVLNDFGLAKMMEATSGLTVTGALTGTPAYMSPEQIEGDKTRIGPASDLYSLGVVLYEMVTGRVPFTADTPMAVILKHLRDPIPLPSVLNPMLPEAVERIILKAMAKDPEDRYQRASRLGRALEQALQGRLPGLAAPLEPIPQPMRWPKLSRLQASLLAVFLLIVVAGIMIAGVRLGTWLQSRGQETPSPGPTAAALTGPTATSTLLSEAPSVSALPPTAGPTDTPTSTPPPMAGPTDTPTSTPVLSPAEGPTDTPPPMATPTDTPVSTPTSAPAPTSVSRIAIARRFAAPGTATQGIAWDGTHIWISDNSGTIFEVDKSGKTIGAFSSPDVTPEGLVWDGSSFWVFTTNDSVIYEFRIEQGKIETQSSFRLPNQIIGGTSDDFAWDGENLWYSDQFDVYRFDAVAQVLAFTFSKKVSGLTWDGQHLWIAHNRLPSQAALSAVDTEGNILATYDSPVLEIESLTWDGSYLWAAGRDSLGGEGAIYQLDISGVGSTVPESAAMPNFNLVGIYRTSREANSLFVAGDVVYLANGGDGLVMLDVSVPSDPAVIGQYELQNAEDVVVADSVAYVIAGNKLSLIDVSTASAPRAVGEYELGSAIRDLENMAVDGHLVALTSHNYLELLDASDPAQLTKVWEWEPSVNSGVPCNPYVVGNTVYAACGWAGLIIFDAADPQDPAELGRFDTPDWIIDIAVVDEVAYLTLGDSGLIRIDVSDPTHPTMMERYNVEGWASDVSVLGHVAYVTYDIRQGYVVEESGLIAFNTKDPYNLTTIARYADMDSATDVHAVGDLVYATDKNRGVVILKLVSAD